MKEPYNNAPRGVSTLELLIAFALITLAMTAAIVVIFGNQTTGVDAQANIEALGKAQALLEQERSLARQDFSALAIGNTTSSDDIYTKKVTVSYPNAGDTDTKLIQVQVTWSDGPLRQLTVKLSTIVTNTLSGAFCSPTLSSPTDWKNPTAYEWPTTSLVQLSPLGSSANGMGLSGISVYRGNMYLSLNATPGSDTHTFYIYGMPSNPASSPTFEGWATTPGNTLADVTVAPNGSNLYAYVVSGKSTSQFQVIDVTTATAPVWKTGLSIPVTGTNASAGAGTSIYYSKGYVYVGLHGSNAAADTEFNIYDVGGGSGSPTSPVWKGGYHVGYTIKSISVSGNYAYLATTDTSSPTNKQVLVLDVSNKANPTLVNSFDAPDSFGVANAIETINSKAYLGKAYSGSTYPNFYIFDASSPASSFPTLGSKTVGSGSDSVNSVAVRGNYVFLVTNSQFQIWDATNPASLVPWTADGTTGSFFSLGNVDAKVNGSSSSSCSGDFLYLALQTSTGNTKDIVAIMGPHTVSSYALGNSGNISVMQGNAGSVTITGAATSGYPGVTNLTVSGLPTGATASWNPGSSCTPGTNCNLTLTISTAATTPTGTYSITVTGSASGGTPTTFNLTVTSLPFNYTLTNSGNITVTQGTSGSNTITRTLTQGVTQAVNLAASGLPTGANATIGSNGCSPTCSGSLSITTAATTPTGTYPITVTDSANGKSTQFNLLVNPPPFDYAITAPASLHVVRGIPATLTATVTRTSGTAASVSVALGNLPSNVSVSSISPSSSACTPSSGSCTVSFTLNATTNATKSSTATLTGTSPTHAANVAITSN